MWFAVPLLSSSKEEVRRLFVRAKQMAARLGKPIRCWMPDKQEAFVTQIAEVYPGVPHRYCANHFVRDLAKPVLEADSHAKVQMRRNVRGLRKIEKRLLQDAATERTAARKFGKRQRELRGSWGASEAERPGTEAVMGSLTQVDKSKGL